MEAVMKLTKAILCTVLLFMLSIQTSYAANETQQDTVRNEWSRLGLRPSDLEGHWAEQVFQWAIRNKMIEGYSDGTYQPDKAVSEAEFLKIYYRAYGTSLFVLSGDDWTEGPYRLAGMWNHPVLGSEDYEARLAPISRRHAAELIASAQGVHYTGDHAILYLLGRSLTNGKTAPTLEGFAGDDLLTRAETVQWLRSLLLNGVLELEVRPKEPSDPALIPPLPDASKAELEDFVLKPVTMEDFDFITGDGKLRFPLGSSREAIEEHIGAPVGQAIGKMDAYVGRISIHYTAEGQMDAWIWRRDMEQEGPAIIYMNSGLKLGECDLSDIIKAYGTGGFQREFSDYLYEEVDGRLVPRASRAEIVNANKAYILSFLIDSETQNIYFAMASTYQFAYYPSMK
jgi:hypothetical protein